MAVASRFEITVVVISLTPGNSPGLTTTVFDGQSFASLREVRSHSRAGAFRLSQRDFSRLIEIFTDREHYQYLRRRSVHCSLEISETSFFGPISVVSVVANLSDPRKRSRQI